MNFVFCSFWGFFLRTRLFFLLFILKIISCYRYSARDYERILSSKFHWFDTSLRWVRCCFFIWAFASFRTTYYPTLVTKSITKMCSKYVYSLLKLRNLRKNYYLYEIVCFEFFQIFRTFSIELWLLKIPLTFCKKKTSELITKSLDFSGSANVTLKSWESNKNKISRKLFPKCVHSGLIILLN